MTIDNAENQSSNNNSLTSTEFEDQMTDKKRWNPF